MFRKKNKKQKAWKMGDRLITISDGRSIITEQFRTMRTNISFALPDYGVKTILVTSSIPGEGKSTNAANLAVVFAQDGKHVLLIDADLRRPTMHQTFGIFNTIGLSSVLVRRSAFYEAIQETPISGLSILPSGPIPPNPAELLSSNAMTVLIEEIKKVYDIVIIDAPPVLPVSDAQILSNICDGTLLIANSGVVKKEEIIKARNTLTVSKGKIVGVVLNNFKMPRNSKYVYEY